MRRGRAVHQSELRSFKRCRRRWWLAYHRQLELAERPATGHLSVGTAVHQCLSFLEQGYALTDVVAALQGEYERRTAERPEKTKELASEAELVRLMVEGFVEWAAETGLAEDLEVYATEAVLEYPLEVVGTEVTLRGTVDARVLRRSTGARLFREYKTVGDLTKPGHVLHLDEQHLFYQLLERLQVAAQQDENGNAWVAHPPTEGSLHVMLRKVKRTARAKPPFYAVMEVRHSDVELRSMWRRTLRTLKDIMFVEQLLATGVSPQEAAYPYPTRDCHWDCDFYPVCPMFDDGSDVEAVVAQLYQVKETDEVQERGEEAI